MTDTLIHRSVGDPARFRERAWCLQLEGALRARAPGLRLTVASARDPHPEALAALDRGGLWLLLGREDGRPARGLRRPGRCLAQAYLPPAAAGPGLLPLPLGPAAPDAPAAPWADRDIDVLFEGWLHPGRAAFFRALPGSPPLPGPLPALLRRWLPAVRDGALGPRSRLRLHGGFGPAADPGFAARLGRARIALCPPGTRQAETFRHWEALRAGCVVLTGPLPEAPAWAGAPLETLQRWEELPARVGALLADPAGLAERHARARAWWAGLVDRVADQLLAGARAAGAA